MTLLLIVLLVVVLAGGGWGWRTGYVGGANPLGLVLVIVLVLLLVGAFAGHTVRLW